MGIAEVIGYGASVIIALSMMMTSIVRLRTIILIGNLLFIAYGIMISAWPVAALNGFNAAVNVFFLQRAFSRKEFFRLLEIRPENMYLIEFLSFYQKQIERFYPGFRYEPGDDKLCLMILRDMHVAGIFIGKKSEGTELEILLDFVIPEYRDLKPGKFLYHRRRAFFSSRGYNALFTPALSEEHDAYFKKMKFTMSGDGKSNILRLPLH